MGWFAFAILGILAAIIAKLVLKQRVGWFLTIVLGILGAMVGGWVAGLFGVTDAYTNFWSISAWLWAIAGAIIVLGLYGLITRRRRTT